MAKREQRFPDGHKVIVCARCGAPANKAKRGGQLLPVKGVQVGIRRNGTRTRRLRLYEHADRVFCESRIRTPLRKPQDRNL